jgi:hypothetical protein
MEPRYAASMAVQSLIAPPFEHEQSPFLDDYFCYTHEKESQWKRRNGDFLITENSISVCTHWFAIPECGGMSGRVEG